MRLINGFSGVCLCCVSVTLCATGLLPTCDSLKSFTSSNMSSIQNSLSGKYSDEDLSKANKNRSTSNKKEKREKRSYGFAKRSFKENYNKFFERKTTVGLNVNDAVNEIFNQDLDDIFLKPLFVSPSSSPSTTPSISLMPSTVPSTLPTSSPSEIPSNYPSNIPTLIPSLIPSSNPTESSLPTIGPTASSRPTIKASSKPSISAAPDGVGQFSSILGRDDSNTKKYRSKSPLFFVLVAALVVTLIGFVCFYDFEKKGEDVIPSESPHLKTIIVSKSGYSDEVEIDLFQDEILNLKIDSGYLVRARSKRCDTVSKANSMTSSLPTRDWA